VSQILEGLNIVEMGCGSPAASIAGMVLADAGARVIKVEPPTGDLLRTENPSGFLVWNRGKESVVADLHVGLGRGIVSDLVTSADVVIEAFAPGVAESWGLGADTLCSSNSRLVHCSISAFGPIGPYANVKGYDSLVAAKAGLWARGAFGFRDGPIMFPVPWGSFGAAMQSVAGIMGALLVRSHTGRGQRIDATLVAGLDPVDYFVSAITQLMVKKGEAPAVDARTVTSASRFGVLLITEDGRFVQTSTILPHQGRALCEVAGIGHVIDDPRFGRMPIFDTADDAQEWEDLLLAAFLAEDLEYWLPRLKASPDIAFEIAITSEQGLDHPQIGYNGDVLTLEDPVVGAIREVGPIGHFEKTPILVERSAPELGVHAGPMTAAPVSRRAGPAPEQPLSGVTIVEFGYFYAMPYALAMAAALGARVIKVEDGAGDPHRNSFGPEVASHKTTAGKESLSVDLRTPTARAIVKKVLATADVFVTGFRSGVAERLGLGYEELSVLNPRLLYVHAAGYGCDGPYAQRALYAQAAQAVGGSFGRQVGYWMDPEQSEGMTLVELQAIIIPRLGQIVDGDSNAALALYAALALGIYHQQTTDEGQKLVTSMIGGNAWAYSDDFCSYEGKPPVMVCDSEYLGTSALERLYQAAGGTWVAISIRTDGEFEALATMLDLGSEERFATRAARSEHDRALEKALATNFAEKSAGDWESALGAVGLGCVEVNMKGQPVFTSFDPVLRETGLTVAVQHPIHGEMVSAAPSVAFSDTPGRVGPPCLRGQHNRSILAELGYTDPEIRTFETNGAVIAPAGHQWTVPTLDSGDIRSERSDGGVSLMRVAPNPHPST
jgi:crotonobetainyl-CoA:carnitine CoA-transferase CaiB-like acyl-CoA transferase